MVIVFKFVACLLVNWRATGYSKLAYVRKQTTSVFGGIVKKDGDQQKRVKKAEEKGTNDE